MATGCVLACFRISPRHGYCVNSKQAAPGSTGARLGPTHTNTRQVVRRAAHCQSGAFRIVIEST
jgi:hypothetical protein